MHIMARPTRLLALLTTLGVCTAQQHDDTAGQPHLTWRQAGNPLSKAFDCGNETAECLLFEDDPVSGRVQARRVSDGGVQWQSATIEGLAGNSASQHPYPDVVASSTNFCFSQTTCPDDSGSSTCLAHVTCIDQKSGARTLAPPSTVENVGGSSVQMHGLPNSGGLLLVASNNAEPGEQQTPAAAWSPPQAWLARFATTGGSNSGTQPTYQPTYNLTFPDRAFHSCLTVGAFPAAPLGGVFVVIADSHSTHGAVSDPPVFAVMLDAGSGATIWNLTVTGIGDMAEWVLVGLEDGSQLLLRGGDGAAFDPQTGKVIWSSKSLVGGFDTVLGDTVLATAVTGVGNSNRLNVISLTDGQVAWQFPTAAQLQHMEQKEVFTEGIQCSIEGNSTGVCFLSFTCSNAPPPPAPPCPGVDMLQFCMHCYPGPAVGACDDQYAGPYYCCGPHVYPASGGAPCSGCKGGYHPCNQSSCVGGSSSFGGQNEATDFFQNCPPALLPAGAAACGTAGSPCRITLDAITGATLYAQTAASGLPSRGCDGKVACPALFRLGDVVMTNGNGGLSAMNITDGAIAWTVPCSGCADAMSAVQLAVPPASECDTMLGQLCAAAKDAGVAQCGMCAGMHAGQLQAAGCTDKDITAWCDSDSHDSDDDPEERTVLVAGSDSSLSNLPAVVVMDPATGATLYTVTLTPLTPHSVRRDEAVAKVFENGQWKIRLLWVQAAVAEGGLTILLDGVHTEDSSDAHVHDSTAEADRVIAQEEQPHVEAAAAEREESSRHRMQIPPPPVTFYNYYTWRVDSV